MKRPTCGDLADEIDHLASHMRNVAARMEYYGGFNERIKAHAAELEGAANQARSWAKGMRTSRMEAEFTRPGGMFRCSACGRNFWRDSAAGWIKSTCILTGQEARLTRIQTPP